MWKIIAQRTISAAIVLLILSVVCFTLIRIAPGDPVEIYLGRISADDTRGSGITPAEYQRTAQFLGTNLPAFYIGLTPKMTWHGTDCHYHHWAAGLLGNGSSLSYRDARPVWEHIAEVLPLTLFINIISLFLTFLIAIPLATYMVRRHQQWPDRALSNLLFALNTIPAFWVGILIVTWAASQFGAFIGMPIVPYGSSRLGHILANIPTLILPIFCLTYGAVAYITQQLRTALVAEKQQDYIKTARAKGVSENKIIRKHALRNALTPIFGLINRLVPGLIGGSFLIEIIFNLQGMGQLTYTAINQHDWPVVMAVVLLTAILSIAGNIVADLLQNYIDPRTI